MHFSVLGIATAALESGKDEVNRRLDINQVILVIGAICGAVIVAGGAAGVIKRWITPILNIQERLQKLEVSREETEKGVEVLCKCMLALMDNAITGNSVATIKSARDEMQRYLISRR